MSKDTCCEVRHAAQRVLYKDPVLCIQSKKANSGQGKQPKSEFSDLLVLGATGHKSIAKLLRLPALGNFQLWTRLHKVLIVMFPLHAPYRSPIVGILFACRSSGSAVFSLASSIIVLVVCWRASDIITTSVELHKPASNWGYLPRLYRNLTQCDMNTQNHGWKIPVFIEIHGNLGLTFKLRIDNRVPVICVSKLRTVAGRS